MPKYAVAPFLWVLGGGSAYGAVFAFVCLAALVLMAASFVALSWERKDEVDESVEVTPGEQDLKGVGVGA